MKQIYNFVKKLIKPERSPKNKPSPVDAKFVIERQQHHVSKTDISPNALLVMNRLVHAGFDAYLVGGSIRDLLLRKAPKDFDIATNALPQEIKKLFKNARVIGRRFKLVHIIFYREIIEVSTFRGHHLDNEETNKNERGMLIRDNVYGTLSEDAFRRDFTINSIYYDLQTKALIDLTEGFKDIHEKRIRMIGDPVVRFHEDPVRILRAIRFAAKLHFTLDEQIISAIQALTHLIKPISSARIFDEIVKLYQCGNACDAHDFLIQYQIFPYFFHQTTELYEKQPLMPELIRIALESTDARIHDNKPVNPAFLFAVFLWFPMLAKAQKEEEEKELHPLVALEHAINYTLAEQCRHIAIPKRLTQVIREIWFLQFQFTKRTKKRVAICLEHPRFRAAYDFLLIRSLVGDAPVELADWWTAIQDE